MFLFLCFWLQGADCFCCYSTSSELAPDTSTQSALYLQYTTTPGAQGVVTTPPNATTYPPIGNAPSHHCDLRLQRTTTSTRCLTLGTTNQKYEPHPSIPMRRRWQRISPRISVNKHMWWEPRWHERTGVNE
ncbi:hypothetical protein B0T17DRAFT_401465 [Bombardia bombarda]|uniref:Uncharacterized protein n=1 Tax=Bombardia bombarda TaxID=252184 RepID=A0AA39WBH6_9PEZI|nr:hypothetical protein B0T17DRAFT_401465 [Bombardia bombarda]